LFPVGATHCAQRADGQTTEALDGLERPLLLHPTLGEPPERHIRFNRFGDAVPVRNSRLGRLSIRVFGLNRGGLSADRLMEQEKASDAIKAAIDQLRTSGEPFEMTIPQWVGPRAEYSRAVRAQAQRRLRKAVAEDEEKLARLRQGLDAEADLPE
jgi:hypothetical protein